MNSASLQRGAGLRACLAHSPGLNVDLTKERALDIPYIFHPTLPGLKDK